MGNSRDIGCSPSANNYCKVDAYVDGAFQIHVLILDHDGNNYDVVVMSARDENEAEGIVIEELKGGGLKVEASN